MTDFDLEYWDALHFAEVYQKWCERTHDRIQFTNEAPLDVGYDTMIQPGCG